MTTHGEKGLKDSRLLVLNLASEAFVEDLRNLRLYMLQFSSFSEPWDSVRVLHVIFIC